MKLFREQLKKIYKEKKEEDAVIGKNINELVQSIHQYNKATPEQQELMKDSFKTFNEKLSELKKEKRFKHEFPKFSDFKNFVKKHKLSLSDLK